MDARLVLIAEMDDRASAGMAKLDQAIQASASRDVAATEEMIAAEQTRRAELEKRMARRREELAQEEAAYQVRLDEGIRLNALDREREQAYSRSAAFRATQTKDAIAQTRAQSEEAKKFAAAKLAAEIPVNEVLDKQVLLLGEDIAQLQALQKQVDITSKEAVAEFLAMVQAQKELSTATGATVAQMAALGRMETQVTKAGLATGALAQGMQPIPARARQAANSVAMLAFAAEGVGIESRRAITSLGFMTTMMAETLGPAKLATIASGIGAVVVVGGTLVSVLDQIKKKDDALREAEFSGFLNQLKAREAAVLLGQYRGEMSRLTEVEKEQVRTLNPLVRLLAQLNDGWAFGERIDLASKRIKMLTPELAALSVLEGKNWLAEREHRRHERENAQVAFANHVREKEGEIVMLGLKLNRVGASMMSRAEAEKERAAADAAVEAQFRLRDAQGELRALTDGEIEQKRKLLALNKSIQDAKAKQIAFDLKQARASVFEKAEQSSEVGGRAMHGKEQELLRQRDAELAAWEGDEAAKAAITERYENEIRKLRRATYDEMVNRGSSAYKKLEAAIRGHWKAGVEGAKNIADAIGRYQMAKQAKRDAAMAKTEWAEAHRSLGLHDYWGAAEHFMSMAGFIASAAENGYGAVGPSAGGGGGGGQGSDVGQFMPNGGNANGGNVTVILQTGNPYSGEAIQRTIYEINRSGVLSKPVTLPYPTSGLLPASN